MTRAKTMTTQIAIKIDPVLLEKLRSFAKDHGTSVSSLMKQSALEYVNKRINGAYTEGQENKGAK